MGGKHCVRNRFFRRQLIFIRLGRGEIPNGAQHRHHPPGEAGIDLIFGSATGGSSYVRGWIFFSTWPWWVGGGLVCRRRLESTFFEFGGAAEGEACSALAR